MTGNEKSISSRALLLLGLALSGVGPAWCQAETLGQTRNRIDSFNADKQETTFGYLVTDALRSATKADLAVINASSFVPGSLNPGDISSDQLRSLFNFPEDKLVVAELSGEVVRRMLERSLSVYPTPNDGFLHVSGLKITFDPHRAAESRVVKIETTSGVGAALDPSKTYKVATSTTLGRGGLGYFKIVGPNPKITRMNLTMLEAVKQFLRTSGAIQYGPERRITPT